MQQPLVIEPYPYQPPSMSLEKREVCYSVKYRISGPFTRSRKKIDAIAQAAIVAYKGAKSCFASAPNADYRKGSSYAVRHAGKIDLHMAYDLFETTATDQLTYVATVFIQSRFRYDPQEKYITDDAIIFNKLHVKGLPTFPREPDHWLRTK